MELEKIKGLGPKTIELFNKLSVYDVNDLIRFYPYRYNVYTPSNLREVCEEDIAIIPGKITSLPKLTYIKRNFNKLSFTLETNEIACNATIFNRAFLKPHLIIGREITLIGKYNRKKNTFVANDIKLYPIYTTQVEPVYHKIHGLKAATITKSIQNALKTITTVDEIIPEYISNKYEFIKTLDAIKEIHTPTNTKSLKNARLKLKYEELFEFMFKINLLKFKNQIFDDFEIKDIRENDCEELLREIPFTLTEDQQKALQDIKEDFCSLKRMNRLLLGDVGSGKTIISFLAILLNWKAGYQSALLAPTEVLANQHFKNFQDLFAHLNIKVELLVGSLSKKEKQEIIKRLENNEIDLLIGTHAILEENVTFSNIGLVVTDEQHRFGVNQRKSLQNKGRRVDVLYMSATPIPRTYALTIYGDMDISIIKTKPSGRKKIETKVQTFSQMSNIMKEIKEELDKGHQAYIVAPLIEENEESELNDIHHIEETVKQYFKEKYKIGILHGKMKQAEKDNIMQSFKNNEIDILLSTTVIEVGIDVKNATIMTIFNAERFGLATLHQLRGRVGRNDLQSKCILISDKKSDRLKVLEESNDGFYISEMDFKLRGSGDLFGIRQSGDMVFKVADLQTDYKILLQCKKDAEEFILENIENDFREYSYYHHILEDLMNNVK